MQEEFLTLEDDQWPDSTISETPSRPLPTPYRSATLPFKANYAASVLSIDSVAPYFGGTKDSLPLASFCDLIDKCVSLERAKIFAVECYKVRYGLIVHRFLLFHLKRRRGRSELWLRVDRMGGKGVVIGGGTSVANDIVSTSSLSYTDTFRLTAARALGSIRIYKSRGAQRKRPQRETGN